MSAVKIKYLFGGHNLLTTPTLVNWRLFWFWGHGDGCGLLLCSSGGVAASKFIDGCEHISNARNNILLQVSTHFTKVLIQLCKENILTIKAHKLIY